MSYVCITGATSGIGYELAKLYANKGRKLILISSNLDKLMKVKDYLEYTYDAKVEIYVQDLSELGAAKKVYEHISKDHKSIDVLINNAGIGVIGPTETIPIECDEKMLLLNVVNLVELCKLILPQMYQRGRGQILNVSSNGAFQPGPYTSSYYASKSFVLSYSRAIRYEAKKKGVSVCTLCPGSTKTNFFHRIGSKTPLLSMTPEEVARSAFEGLSRNKEVIVPGKMNKIIRLLPQKVRMLSVALIKKQ